MEEKESKWGEEEPLPQGRHAPAARKRISVTLKIDPNATAPLGEKSIYDRHGAGAAGALLWQFSYQ
jgi:hypothetical protein